MAKAKPRLPALSEAQLEIMDVVWEGGEVTVTDVWNVLAGRRQLARNTVLTLMDRLEKKGWLKRRAEGQTHFYSAASPRADTLGGVCSTRARSASSAVRSWVPASSFCREAIAESSAWSSIETSLTSTVAPSRS